MTEWHRMASYPLHHKAKVVESYLSRNKEEKAIHYKYFGTLRKNATGTLGVRSCSPPGRFGINP